MLSTWAIRAKPLREMVVHQGPNLRAHLADGRIISVPLSWYPRLLHATPEERSNYEIGGRGRGIHWSAIDEDISVQNLLEGRKSDESESSLRRWIDARKGREEGRR